MTHTVLHLDIFNYYFGGISISQTRGATSLCFLLHNTPSHSGIIASLHNFQSMDTEILKRI